MLNLNVQLLVWVLRILSISGILMSTLCLKMEIHQSTSLDLSLKKMLEITHVKFMIAMETLANQQLPDYF